MKRFILSALFFIALLAIWHLLVLAKVWSVVLLPDPISVLEYLKGAVGDGTLLQASLVTMRRLLAGYVIGIAAGLPLGLLTARFKFCEDTLGVLALGLQTLPSVCWVPLALLWFGQTETAMLFVVIMGTLWSVIIATDNAFATCHRSSHAPPERWARGACTPGSTSSYRRRCHSSSAA
jgi:NitT/TauT family transport system permease protein